MSRRGAFGVPWNAAWSSGVGVSVGRRRDTDKGEALPYDPVTERDLDGFGPVLCPKHGNHVSDMRLDGASRYLEAVPDSGVSQTLIKHLEYLDLPHRQVRGSPRTTALRDLREVFDHLCCNIWREHGAPSGNLADGVNQLLLGGVLEEVAL